MSIGHKAGLAAQIAGELSAVIVLDDDRVLRGFEDVEDGLAMQWYQPADLELICRDSLLVKHFACFSDHAISRSPSDQGDFGVAKTEQMWRWNCSINPGLLPHALFHHGAALDGIREFVADKHTVFIVLVSCGRMDVAWHSG